MEHKKSIDLLLTCVTRVKDQTGARRRELCWRLIRMRGGEGLDGTGRGASIYFIMTTETAVTQEARWKPQAVEKIKFVLIM